MAEPLPHSKTINDLTNFIISQITGEPTDAQENIRKDTCWRCGKPATEFDDSISRREFTISGLCQKCQNEIFIDPEEE